MVHATALATLIKGRGDHIVVGDNVILQQISAESDEAVDSCDYQIVEIEERKNEVWRVIQREASLKKVTAANCDLLVIMMSVSRPEYKRGLVDRYLIRSIQWGIPAVLVFNKMDQFEDNFDLDFETDRLKSLDVDSFELSAKFPEYQKKYLDRGLDELKERLKGKTAIFLGQSGVGKSKLITALTDGRFSLKTAEIGNGGKGSHTTTWAEIVDCDDFTFIDSPGVRSLSLDDLMEESLPEYFPDLFDYFSRCKFTNCTHAENAKGCAFNELDKSERNSQLVLSRLESYIRIDQEVSVWPHWEKK